MGRSHGREEIATDVGRAAPPGKTVSREEGTRGKGFTADPDLEVFPAVVCDLNTLTNGHGDRPP